MLPEPVNAPTAERPPDLLAGYVAYLAATGRGTGKLALSAARTFFRRWPDPQDWAATPLPERLATSAPTRPLLTFLMLQAHLRPGYDYLVARKLPALWREMPHSPMAGDLTRFTAAAAELGFSERHRSGAGSQVVARLLIQTGRRLEELTGQDLDELAGACADRIERTGANLRHYSSAIHTTRQVLFHLGVLAAPPVNLHTRLRQSLPRRMADVPDSLRPSFEAYLDRLTATHARSTVGGAATRLVAFGRHLAQVDPTLLTLADLDRRRHIESYLTAVARATHTRTGAPLAAGERRARVIAVSCFLADITEWGWPEAPARKLIFRADVPKLERPLPRYLTPDLDRRLAEALRAWPNRLPADALLLARATGLRVGEIVDLELDCVHEIPGQGAWLKVPLGKLDTERMVPLDEETITLVDRIVAHRSPGRPIPHPRTHRPTEFLLTRHGQRISTQHLQQTLRQLTRENGLPHTTPHQLRHTYATALVNAGVSLQSLMALLGHVSAGMSLRYGKLFDTTVRAEYERALTLAKERLGSLPAEPPPGRATLPLLTGDWKQTPTIKARLAGGFCVRAQAQGPCAYANICEHCPSFRTDAGFLPVLAAQRLDAEALAADAQARGWITEADRHHQLIARLDAHIHAAEATG